MTTRRSTLSLIPALLTCLALAACGSEERSLENCSLCLTEDGACASGCACSDPLALCQAYLDALCTADTACRQDAGSTEPSPICALDCSEMSDCERFGLSAYPDELWACIDSIPQTACAGADGLEGPTPACAHWLELARNATEDSLCTQDGSGASQASGGPAGS